MQKRRAIRHQGRTEHGNLLTKRNHHRRAEQWDENKRQLEDNMNKEDHGPWTIDG